MKNFDPFIVVCVIMIAFAFFFFAFLVKTENENKNKRAELVKEAIEKNWTPEQVKVLLDAR
jgi:F0F1-type ATP synthase membrane subunit b/b'